MSCAFNSSSRSVCAAISRSSRKGRLNRGEGLHLPVSADPTTVRYLSGLLAPEDGSLCSVGEFLEAVQGWERFRIYTKHMSAL